MGVDQASSCIPRGSATAPGLLISKIEIMRVAFLVHGKIEIEQTHPFFRFNVPVNISSVMSGRSHRFPGIASNFHGVKCLAQGHNTAEVGFETQTSRFTTEPSPSPR